MVETANMIWRDHVTDGVPSSGAHEPEKAKIRSWGTRFESLIAAGVLGENYKETKALLDADLAHDDGNPGVVWNDPTSGNNGIYIKSGASGSGNWDRVADLPYGFISLSNTDSGDENAITATSDLPMPTTARGALLALNVIAENTGAVTISVNGDTPKTLVTSVGGAIPASYLVAGMQLLFVDDGTNFRLFSYGDATAVQAAAELAAAQATTAAASAVGSIEFGTVSDLLADNNVLAGYTSSGAAVEFAGGESFYAGGYRYTVAPSGATDQHLTTAGGLKLYAEPTQDKFLNPEQFNISTGSADASAELALAIAALPAGGVFDGGGRTFNVLAAIGLKSDITLKNIKLDASGAGAITVLNAVGTIGSAIALTSGAGINSKTFNVADGSAFSAGQDAYLLSDALWEDTGTVYAEIVRIHSVSGNAITLLEYPHLSFSTGDNATLAPLTMLSNINVDNVEIIGEYTEQQVGMSFQYCKNVNVNACHTENLGQRHFWFQTCHSYVLQNSIGYRADPGGVAYYVSNTNSCRDYEVRNCKATEFRHLFTCGGNQGPNRNFLVADCTSYDSINSGFDVHTEADGFTFRNCVTYGADAEAGADGIIVQGRNFTVMDCKVFGCARHGIFVQSNPNGQNDSYAKITNCVIELAGEDGINFTTNKTSSYESLQIDGNTVKDATDSGIKVTANNADIQRLLLNNNNVSGTSGSGICFDIRQGGSNSINSGAMTGNVASRIDDSNPNVFFNGGSGTNIQRIAITGNALTNGTIGIEGVNVNRFCVVGNVLNGMSGAEVDVAGAQSVSANNVTS